MDCSGTIYYLLQQASLNDVPRSSEEMFLWVKKSGRLHKVGSNSFNSKEFSALKPGDLLFWSGTYHTQHSISHVMLYLGKDTHGHPLMFGSSDGRTYLDRRMWGVSVFDFKLPNAESRACFIGYSCIPGLGC